MTGALFALLAGVVVSAPSQGRHRPRKPGRSFRAATSGRGGRQDRVGRRIRAAIRAAIAAGPGRVLSRRDYIAKAEGRRDIASPSSGLGPHGPRCRRSTRIVIADPTCGDSTSSSRRTSRPRLSFDYDPVPFCQGPCGPSMSSGHFDWRWTRLPDAGRENFVKATSLTEVGMILDRETRRIKAGTPDHYMTRVGSTRGRTWRFFTPRSTTAATSGT